MFIVLLLLLLFLLVWTNLKEEEKNRAHLESIKCLSAKIGLMIVYNHKLLIDISVCCGWFHRLNWQIFTYLFIYHSINSSLLIRIHLLLFSCHLLHICFALFSASHFPLFHHFPSNILPSICLFVRCRIFWFSQSFI